MIAEGKNAVKCFYLTELHKKTGRFYPARSFDLRMIIENNYLLDPLFFAPSATVVIAIPAAAAAAVM